MEKLALFTFTCAVSIVFLALRVVAPPDFYLGSGSKVQELATVCPRSIDPFYVITYYIKWVTTSLAYSISPRSIFIVYSEYKMAKTSWTYGIVVIQ